MLHSGTIGCVEGYPENQNAVVPFLPLMVQMILNKAFSNVGVCLISYEKKKDFYHCGEENRLSTGEQS